MTGGISIEGLEVRYGKLEAVKQLDLSVRGGELVAIVGPNGAGKSTTVRCLAGLVTPASGHLFIDGINVNKLSPEERVRLNLAFVPEDRGIFRRLTVQENLKLGRVAGAKKSGSGLDLTAVTSLFPILGERQTQAAGLLSGGEQQQLAIARALLTKPSYLVIDEPSLGLGPQVITTVYEALRKVRDDYGLGILVVEQSLRRVQKYANRVLILREGMVRSEHAVDASIDFAELEKAYFGVE
ncbi:ABC transporter ATP-binding protein [Rhizobium leguminosarum bv. trifolii]|uniref:ABC transporter ATP-binding protein n=1 Tax=Rhizobium leguminosarum TaxID=384 RepID=UPI000E2EE304|nr:ABC transporter ATP-binding protein [Rhizobium leguminosarum]RFB87068.1 ABC transporter ATP-binding protein [Rhizobium leguminosarum bv. trifolii]